MNKELIKEILYEHIYAELLSYASDIKKDEEFKFQYSEDKKYIEFKMTTELIYGNDCWDSPQERKYCSGHSFDSYRIWECSNKKSINC